MHKDNIRVGQRVVVNLKSPRKLPGVVKFIGRINSLPGDFWVGIELYEPHPHAYDGTLEGRWYFNARSYHAVFAAPNQIELETAYLRRLRLKSAYKATFLKEPSPKTEPNLEDFEVWDPSNGNYHLRHLIGTKPAIVDSFDTVFSSDKPSSCGFGLDTSKLLTSTGPSIPLPHMQKDDVKHYNWRRVASGKSRAHVPRFWIEDKEALKKELKMTVW